VNGRTFLAGTGAVLLAAPLAAEAQPTVTQEKAVREKDEPGTEAPGLVVYGPDGAL
jgi:hypothetical protein